MLFWAGVIWIQLTSFDSYAQTEFPDPDLSDLKGQQPHGN